MVLDSKINVQQIKEIAQQIAQEQIDKYGLDIKLLPMTIVEYYNSDIFRKNLVCTEHGKTRINTDALTLPFAHSAVYYSKTKRIILFVKGLNRITATNYDELLPCFISLAYHELRHSIQRRNLLKTTNVDLSIFAYDLETVVHKHDKQDYSDYHDDYFFEIDADSYGINKAIEYLERNHMLSEGAREYLTTRKKQCESRLKRYDFQRIFKRFHDLVLCKTEIAIEDLGWLGEVFYNQDKTFKTVTEILKHPSSSYIDASILQIVFSSKPFLANIDFQSLACENKTFIIESLRNSYYHEQTRRAYIKECLIQGLIDETQWSNLDTNCSHNIHNYVTNLSDFFHMMLKDASWEMLLDEEIRDFEQDRTI